MSRITYTTRLLALSVAASALTVPGIASAETQATPSGETMTKPAEDAPLIPREALFGNPSKAQGRVSPDGQWLSWLAPKDCLLYTSPSPRD